MFHVVIPARYSSSRLPGKPLLPIEGRPMLQWVWERARESGATTVTIATDDQRILDAARGFSAACVMTSPHHASGTDRIAEVVSTLHLGNADIVVNLQGDEPMMPATVIAAVAQALIERPEVDIATAVAPVASLTEFLNSNCVKAVRARDGRALYFSRAAVPWPRDQVKDGMPSEWHGAWRHIGIYAYRARSLARFAALPPTGLENTEKLEQLRALEHGMSIHLVALAEAPPAGVDTLDDLERVRSSLRLEH